MIIKRAESAAYKLIEQSSSRDPFEICDFLEIHVIKCKLPDNIKGFYQKNNENKIIYINQNLEENKKKIVCAHELGHAIMHDGINLFFYRENGLYPLEKWEKEADLFCATLIIDDAIDYESIDNICYETGISKEIVKLKYNII